MNRLEAVVNNAHCSGPSQLDLQAHLRLHLKQCLRVASSVIHWMMCMARLPQVLKRLERVLDQPLVQRTEILRAKAKGVAPRKMMEIPIHKTPIESVVIGNKNRTLAAVLLEPLGKLLHHNFRVVKGHRLFARETANLQGIGIPLLGNWLHLPVKRRAQLMLFDRVEDLLATNATSREDQLCYQARLAGQRGFHLTKPRPGAKPKLQEAWKLFDALEEDPAVPFACFRRNSGLAYCNHLDPSQATDPSERWIAGFYR